MITYATVTWPKMLAIGISLTISGCARTLPEPNSPTAAKQDSSSAQAATSETTGEIAKPFDSFESEISQQAAHKSNDETDQVSKAVPTHTEKSPKELAREQLAQPAIAPPSAEQLKAWAAEPFEEMQLLVCRDGGKAGFLTKVEVFGDNGQYALAGSRLTAWSLDKEEPEFDFSDPANEQSIKSFVAAADGKWVASGDSKGNLQIWDTADFKQRIAKKIYASGVAHLSVSPDSQEIAASSYQGEVTLLDAAQLTVKNKFRVASQALQNLLFIAPGRLAVAAQDTTIWDTKAGKLEHTLATGGYNATLAISPDGKWLAYTEDSKLKLWSIQDSKLESTIVGGFSNHDLAAFSSDGNRLVTASKFLIQIWDTSHAKLLQVIDTFGWDTVGLRWLPKSDLLLIASENGRVRVWGSLTAAASRGLKPLHAPIELPPAESTLPAYPSQIMQTIDIRTFPRLPGALLRMASDTFLDYRAAVTMEEAKTFYEHFLTREGWSRVTSAMTGPDGAVYHKQGFRFYVSMYSNGDGTIQINLNHSGNVDLRRLPKYEAIPSEDVYASEISVQYRTKADLLDIESTLIRKFHEAGWTSYARLNSSHNEEVDGRDLLFISGATTLQVSIDRPPVAPADYHVSYNSFLTTKSLPIPKDSGFVEFDGSTAPYLVANTAMSLEQTRDFFGKEMALQGWLRRDSGKQFKEKTGWMDFIRGQCDVRIVLDSLPSGRTQIRVGEGLENSSWQLKKIPELDPTVAAIGIEAADVPVLNGWKIIKYNPEEKQIDLVADNSTTFAVAEAYSKEFESKGWKSDGSGVKSNEYLLARFAKGKSELTLRATLRGNQINASISGDGLNWTKPLPVAKQVIAYETWLRINRHPATLDLLDKYVTEMKETASINREKSNATK